MKNDCFLILIDGSQYKTMYEYMFSETEELENAYLIADKKNENTLKHILLRRKVQKITQGYFDFLYIEKNNLFDWLDNHAGRFERIYIIITNAALNYNPYLYGTLLAYKNIWKSIRYVLFYLDIVGCGPSRYADYLRNKGLFDLIYSIDKEDCEKYDLVRTYTVYSKTNNNTYGDLYDLYFAGVSKHRFRIIKYILDSFNMQNKKGRVKIDLVYEDDDSEIMKYKDLIALHSKGNYLDYSYILREELSSNVILDVVQPGQTALTLRAYEAVVYNKKLLTNNTSIFEFPYYSEKYMKYFDENKEIDWEWIKKRDLVDYGYKGEFSLERLMRNIQEKINF